MLRKIVVPYMLVVNSNSGSIFSDTVCIASQFALLVSRWKIVCQGLELNNTLVDKNISQIFSQKGLVFILKTIALI